MAGNVSLESSIRTCKVDTGYANRVQSDRFLNPNNNICLQANMFDSAGRPSCYNSLYTKAPGCNSAEDRIAVENMLRPRYSEYVSRGMDGLQYGGLPHSSLRWDDMKAQNDFKCDYSQRSGDFGFQMSSKVYPSCGRMMAYERGMAQEAQTGRQYDALNSAYSTRAGKTCSGM